jgi:hypothetical protein
VRLDLWTGGVSPFRFDPWVAWARGLPQPFPHYDNVYSGSCLERLPERHGGKARFLVSFSHLSDFPEQLLVFDEVGSVELQIHHPGRFNYPPVVVRDPRGREMILVCGVNNRLGMRGVVFALPVPGDVTIPAAVGAPPFDLPIPEDSRPYWYTFLPAATTPLVTVQGNVVSLTFGSTATSRLDLNDGVPLDAADRGGLGIETWRDRQARLLDLLSRVADLSERGRDAEAAEDLEAFAAAPDLAPAQRGVSLARGAELRRRSGDLTAALRDADGALAAEPAITGHYRLVIDLLARQGRWDEILRREKGALGEALRHAELQRDLAIAALVTGHESEARTLYPYLRDATGGSSYYGTYCAALLALHRGDAAEALRVLGLASDPGPELDFLRALALALDSPPRVEQALRKLAVASESKGVGQALPFVPLEAYLDRLGGRRVPRDAEIAASLADQRASARENLVDLYWLPWGEALAAAADLAGGATSARDRIEAAGRAPGAGAFLRRLEKSATAASGAAQPWFGDHAPLR